MTNLKTPSPEKMEWLRETKERLPLISLTPRQRDCLIAICIIQDRDVKVPSVNDVADELSIGKARAHWLMIQLEERGWIKRRVSKPRDLMVVRKPFEKLERAQAFMWAAGELHEVDDAYIITSARDPKTCEFRLEAVQ